MRVARDGDAAAVEIACIIELAQLFERLATVEIGGGVVRIGLGDGFESGDGAIEVARFDVFHGQAIAGERARGVLRQELFEDFDSGGFQTVRIPANEDRAKRAWRESVRDLMFGALSIWPVRFLDRRG